MLRALSERLLAIYSPFSSGTTPAEDFTVLKDSLRVEDLSMYRSLAPAPPPMNHFVEAAADTSCAKLAMGPVSQEDCSAACTALGFKSTGPKARANVSGCDFVTFSQHFVTFSITFVTVSINFPIIVSLCPSFSLRRCFVLTTGEYAGNCNYNTNKSATCTPPCTLMGAGVRVLCDGK